MITYFYIIAMEKNIKVANSALLYIFTVFI